MVLACAVGWLDGGWCWTKNAAQDPLAGLTELHRLLHISGMPRCVRVAGGAVGKFQLGCLPLLSVVGYLMPWYLVSNLKQPAVYDVVPTTLSKDSCALFLAAARGYRSASGAPLSRSTSATHRANEWLC